MAGSGGLGVGAWQAYEGFVSDGTGETSTPVKREGYSWTPPTVPNESVPSDGKKFEWKNWNSCTKKLFPNLTIKNEDSSQSVETNTLSVTQTTQTNGDSVTYKYYFDAIEKDKVTDNFLVCALLDQRGGNDGSKEDIYFKSEVAVKDDSYGWIMWNGLSTTKGNTSTITLEYRLLLLKKDNNAWKIDKGFGWTSPKANGGNQYDQLHVTHPIGGWKTTNQNKGNYSSRQVWSGIAKVDTSATTSDNNEEENGKDLLSSLEIYMKKKDGSTSYSAEFFGSKGSWVGSGTTEGYQNTDKYYDSSSGWKTISSPIQLGDSLKRWYEQQREKNLKWMTCESWAKENQSDNSLSSVDQAIRDMCYTKINN